MKEYLPQIGSRQKRYFRNDNLWVGDVVVVIDPGTVRQQWNVGRMQQTYSGLDGLVQVVDIQVNGKTLKRPITRISPLEIRYVYQSIIRLMCKKNSSESYDL